MLEAGDLLERFAARPWVLGHVRVTSPDPAAVVTLNGVAATSARSAWAVGYDDNPVTSDLKSLILRWNGKTWSQVTAAAPGVLLGLATTSATNAWAVGFTQPSRNVGAGPAGELGSF